jgi:DNA-binding response OmpR family regulator
MMAPRAPYTVLIVDDNPALLDLINESLTMIGGFTVFTATNGVEGLERFYAVRPDCMVIDVKMPQLDGYQLVRILRGDPESASTPLVILTAMVQDKDRFAGLASGADQYLLKPTKPRELVEAIGRAIAMSADTRAQALRRLAEAPPPAES